MRNSNWWMLLPVTVAAAITGIFYVLLPERFLTDHTLAASVLIAAISAGVLVYSPMSGGGSKSNLGGMFGALGIGTVVSFLLLLVASTGVALAITGLEKGAMALDILTVAGFAAYFISMRAMASNAGSESSRRGGKSSHIAWADRLEGIAKGCAMPMLKPRLLKLAGETRFLASDEGSFDAEVNHRIAGVLDTVADAVRRGDEQGAMHQLKRLRNLFSERESELTSLKSKP